MPPNAAAKSVYDDRQKYTTTYEILELIFSMTIAIMMFLCFFSLIASMTANLFDQSKEVGVLRSIGLTKWRIRLLFFYEAVILVFAACLLGVLVGTTVGYTMVLQENLFMETDLDIFVPWKSTLEILLISIVCAFFATFGPTSDLVRRPIASIFRIL